MTGSRFLIRSSVWAVLVVAGACGADNEKKEAGATADAVQIVNFQFKPQTLTVEAGSKVTWTNEDTAVHSIKDTSPLATPVSPDMEKGATFSVTYGQPGSYSYICGIHQYMTGTVTVVA